MPALLRPRGRSTGTSCAGVVEVVLDERATGTGEHGTELVGVDESATAGPDHLRGVVVERAQQLGRRLLDAGDHPGARLRAEAHGHRERLAVRDGHAALGHDLLDAGTVGQRADLGAQRGQADLVDVDDRPDVDPDVVHVQLRAGAPASHAGTTDGLQAVLHRTLGVRQGRDRAGLVADHGHLADLREGDQSPVGRVLPRDAVVEQHVLGRLDARHVEVAQPPQVQAPARPSGARRG